MAEFDQAWAYTKLYEGGYADDPLDPGGETYMGISRKYNPNWTGWVVIDANQPLARNGFVDSDELSQSVAAYFKVNYWDVLSGDAVKSQPIMNFFFDWHVTSGVWPIIHLQKILDITPLGKFDFVTLDALNRSDYPDVYSQLLQARASFYEAVVQAHPKEQKFLAGWLKRDKSYPQEDDVDPSPST